MSACVCCNSHTTVSVVDLACLHVDEFCVVLSRGVLKRGSSLCFVDGCLLVLSVGKQTGVFSKRERAVGVHAVAPPAGSKHRCTVCGVKIQFVPHESSPSFPGEKSLQVCLIRSFSFFSFPSGIGTRQETRRSGSVSGVIASRCVPLVLSQTYRTRLTLEQL